MSKKAWLVTGSFIFAFMAVIAIIAFASIDVCPQLETSTGTTPMKCHWAFLADAWIGLLGLLLSGLLVSSKNKDSRRNACITVIAVCIIVAIVLSPIGIGICAHDDSGCHMPAYAIWALSAINAILAIVMLAKSDPAISEKPKLTL